MKGWEQDISKIAKNQRNLSIHKIVLSKEVRLKAKAVCFINCFEIKDQKTRATGHVR